MRGEGRRQSGADSLILNVYTSVRKGTSVYVRYCLRMPANTSAEIGVRDLRTKLSDVLHETTVRGRITYVTSRGRRVAAIVPVDVAEAAESAQSPAPSGA